MLLVLCLLALIFHFLLVPMIHYFVIYFYNYYYRPLKSQIQTYIHLLFTMKKKFHKGINLLQFEFFSSRICQGIRKIIICPMVLWLYDLGYKSYGLWHNTLKFDTNSRKKNLQLSVIWRDNTFACPLNCTFWQLFFC